MSHEHLGHTSNQLAHCTPSGTTCWQRTRQNSLPADMCIFQVPSWQEHVLSSVAHALCQIQQPQVGEQSLMCDILPPSMWLYFLLLQVCPHTSSSGITRPLAEMHKFGSHWDPTSEIAFQQAPGQSCAHCRARSMVYRIHPFQSQWTRVVDSYLTCTVWIESYRDTRKTRVKLKSSG